MRTSCRIYVDFGHTKRTLFGCRVIILGMTVQFCKTVESLDKQKYDKRHNDKVYYLGDKRTVSDGDTHKRNAEVIKAVFCKKPENRRKDVFYQ